MNKRDQELVERARWIWENSHRVGYRSEEFDKMLNEAESQKAKEIISRIDHDMYRIESERENSCWW